MNRTKCYQILDGLPPYGTMAISISEDETVFYAEGFPVRLYKSDGSEWVANFFLGQSNLKEIHELNDSPHLLVIAYGICYIMNPDQTTPISVFGTNCSQVFKTADGRFVLHNQTELILVEPTGAYWISENISMEQLKDLKLENNVVTGLSFDYSIKQREEWIHFSLHLDTKLLTYECDSRNRKSEKKWWKRYYPLSR